MEDEVTLLGLWAARCELFAAQTSGREREILLTRADHYRDLQLVALADPMFDYDETQIALKG